MKKIFALIVALLAGTSMAMNAQASAAFVIGKYCAYGIGYHENDMHAAVNAAYYYCKKHKCVDPKLRGSAGGQGYTAIAVGARRDGCYYGFALNQTTREEAIRLAMMHCSKYGSCKVKAYCFGDQCKTSSPNLPQTQPNNKQPPAPRDDTNINNR